MNLSAAVLKNVVSQETDVREVLAKVALGEADAGFVYSTDARTVPGKVKVIKVPAWAQPKVQYGICVVSRSQNKADAQAFIKKVLSKAGPGEDARGTASCRGSSRSEEVAAGAERWLGVALRRWRPRHRARVPRAADRRDLRRTPRPGTLLDQLSNPVVKDAFVVTPEDERRSRRR